MKDFMVRALEWEATQKTATHGHEDNSPALENCNLIELKQRDGGVMKALLVHDDVTMCISNAFLNRITDYNGASVIFLDIPKVI